MEVENSDQTEIKSQNIVENPPSRKNIFTQKGNFLLIIGIVILMLVIGGGYYFGTQKNQQSNTTLISSPSAGIDSNFENNTIAYFVQSNDPVSTEGRSFPVYGIYQQIKGSNQPLQLLTVGKENEYVEQILLSKSQKLLIIQFEDKLMFYNLKTRKSQILFNKLEIDGVTLSPDQNLLATTIRPIKDGRDYRIDIINLADYSEKTSLPQTIPSEEPTHSALIPYFWSADTKLYLTKTIGEGRSDLYVLSLNTSALSQTNMPIGKPNSDGSKMAYRTTAPPYGGCAFAATYKIGWYKLLDNSFSLIAQMENTYYEIIKWSPQGDELLYTAQKYKPDPTCTKALETEPVKVYIYNVGTKTSQKIDSIENQLSIWYPEETSFYKQKGAEKDFMGSYLSEKSIDFLGSIELSKN